MDTGSDDPGSLDNNLEPVLQPQRIAVGCRDLTPGVLTYMVCFPSDLSALPPVRVAAGCEFADVAEEKSCCEKLLSA